MDEGLLKFDAFLFRDSPETSFVLPNWTQNLDLSLPFKIFSLYYRQQNKWYPQRCQIVRKTAVYNSTLMKKSKQNSSKWKQSRSLNNFYRNYFSSSGLGKNDGLSSVWTKLVIKNFYTEFDNFL